MQRAVGEKGDNAIKKTESKAESRNIQTMIRNVVSLFLLLFYIMVIITTHNMRATYICILNLRRHRS